MVIQLVVYCPVCGLKNYREVNGICAPSYIRCDCGRRVSLVVEPAELDGDLLDVPDAECNLAEAEQDSSESAVWR